MNKEGEREAVREGEREGKSYLKGLPYSRLVAVLPGPKQKIIK